MKRNWRARALRTLKQNFVGTVVFAAGEYLATGEYQLAMWAALVAGLGAINSAVQGAWENRTREGEVEDA